MMSKKAMERMRLRSLSFPVDSEHMERFQAYLASLRLAQHTQLGLYRAMQRFGRSYAATNKNAYATYILNLCPMDSQINTFKSAYHHYQRMCESGYRPDGRAHPRHSDPKPDFWEQFGLKPRHPARVLCKQIFENKTLSEINFRQTEPDEWQFYGEEMRYRVTVCNDQCVLDAWSARTGHIWMHRLYPVDVDG